MTFRARKMLCAIDNNYHLHQLNKFNESGDIRYCRKYNQRTKHWDVAAQKCAKDYTYIPMLLAKILKIQKKKNWMHAGLYGDVS